MKRLFSLHSAVRLVGHGEGAVQHIAIVGLDADEVHAVIKALRIDLSRIAVDFLGHHTLTDGIVDLDAAHAFTLDVQHTRSRVRIELQAAFEFVDAFRPGLECSLGAIEGLTVNDSESLHHIDGGVFKFVGRTQNPLELVEDTGDDHRRGARHLAAFEAHLIGIAIIFE